MAKKARQVEGRGPGTRPARPVAVPAWIPPGVDPALVPQEDLVEAESLRLERAARSPQAKAARS